MSKRFFLYLIDKAVEDKMSFKLFASLINDYATHNKRIKT